MKSIGDFDIMLYRSAVYVSSQIVQRKHGQEHPLSSRVISIHGQVQMFDMIATASSRLVGDVRIGFTAG